MMLPGSLDLASFSNEWLGTTWRTYISPMERGSFGYERAAVASYTEIATWLGDGDPTTRRMLEWILAQEEEHAEDMLDLLTGLK